MKGQILAIVLVIASGISAYVMLISAMDSLRVTQEKYYREYRFAHVFASLKRAPESLKRRIGEIPGVDKVETRVVAEVKLDIAGFPEPVTARAVSLPDTGPPLLNALFVRKGRLPEPWTDKEAVVSESFAEAHGFEPGDRFGAVINGRWKKLTIVGIGLSPEFVLQARPGALSPDYKRYGILWMGREALGTAYGMEGAFNDVVLTLSAGTNPADVIARLDRVLERYGGLGAYARKDQISHRFLSEEFRQLQRSAQIYPTIFIAVSAFLLNVVISRTISTQRDLIGVLKGFGYNNLAIGMHYIKMVMMVAMVGSILGIGLGIWMGEGLGNIYMKFYRFPYLIFDLRPGAAMIGVGVTVAAALGGTLHSLYRAASLPPAEAMRPEPPARYRKTMLEHLGMGRLMSQPTRMIIRNIERRPVKSLLTVIGIAMSCAIMIAGAFAKDSVEFMMQVQFSLAQKADMTVTFSEPTSWKALYELKRMAGIEHAEAFRAVPVRLRFGHRGYRTFIQGVEPGNHLYYLLDKELKPIEPPPKGIVLTDYLGSILDIKPGDNVTVEVLEGRRGVYEVPVAGFVSQYVGLSGYMELAALNRLMDEGGAISGAWLAVDSLHKDEVYRSLVEMPRVVGTVVREEEIKNFYETQAEFFLFFTFIATLLAGTIAFGVVYNSARIALSERGRELASLRVLGYTRAEIAYIMLGEVGLLALAAIPLGLFFGYELCDVVTRMLSSDLYRVPLVVSSTTYSMAAAVVVVSACLSGLIVKYRLDRLDLVAVLKARE